MGLFNKFKKTLEPQQDVGQLSVLAVANDAANIEDVFSALRKFQHKAKLVHDISGFIDALGESDPDVILMSLNLKNTDVVKVITVLQSLGLPCIAFGENDDEDTFLKLLGTEIHHTLIPPASFETFMERVEFLAMEKDLNPNKSQTQNSPDSQSPLSLSKPQWGKIIQILKDKLLDQGQVIIQDRAQSPEMASLGELTPVSETDLSVGKALEVDVFIAMPLNHKCILYMRKGNVLLKENLERLRRYGSARVLKRRAA